MPGFTTNGRRIGHKREAASMQFPKDTWTRSFTTNEDDWRVEFLEQGNTRRGVIDVAKRKTSGGINNQEAG